MIYRSAHPQTIVDGRLPNSMSVRGPSLNLPDMPPQFKLDSSMVKSRRTILGPPTTFNQSHFNPSIQVREDIPHMHHVAHPGSEKTSNLQPFTAPWLTEVARMTPVRPLDPHLPFHSTPDFLSRIHGGLVTRPPLYNPRFLPPQPYLRDYVHSQHHSFKSNLHTPDLIHESISSTSIGPNRLGPIHHPPLSSRVSVPARNIHDLRVPLDFRDQISPNDNFRPIMSHSIPTESDEPSPKRRLIRFSEPCSFSRANVSKPSLQNEISLTHKNKPSPVISESEHSPQNKELFADQEPTIRADSPFHSHFLKGSFVSLPYGVQKVEDMQTKDFVDATDASTTLKLDPSKVEAIEQKNETNTSTITFSFASTKTQIAVEASNSHPFFVFHRGWSSCNPQKTEDKYGLKTYQLCAGDVCISLKKIDHTEDAKTSMPPPKAPIKPSAASSSKYESTHIPPLSTVPSDFVDAVSINDKNDLTFRQNFPQSSARPEVKSSVGESSKHVARGRKRRWSDPGR